MLDQLLKDLNSRKLAVREAALRQAHGLPPEQLLELAEMESKAYRRRRRRRISLLFSVFFILASLSIAARIYVGRSLQDLGFWIHMLQILPVLYLAYSPTRARRDIATIIKLYAEDTRFVGTALNILAQDSSDANLRKDAVAALSNLLPNLPIEQAVLLSQEQRRALLIPLATPYDNVELTLSILKTLEQAGDEKAIPVVKKLAEEGAATVNMRRVKQAAQECLPYLQIRVEQLQQAQTLLRASDASTTVASDVLLRPAAANVTETPPEQLLRAARSES